MKKRRRAARCWPAAGGHLLLLVALLQVRPAQGHYFASLPRLGHAGGLLLREPAPGVVAFLGLPYAAPPVGPLRFMPPGGLGSAGGAAEQRTLEPSAQRVLVRAARSFGRQCPRLADWLPEARAPPKDQSEDCLYLNLFVPLPSNSNGNLYSNNQSRAMNRQAEVRDGRRANHSGADNNEEPMDQEAPLKPLPQRRLPVLVLVQSDGREANSLSHGRTARATNALVVTFSYRSGLLGFLPFADEDSAPRNNHAIWDQLGLLHWLRQNVAHFGADPQSITLMPADNHALQLVQLLALSPQAKGLFRRAVLVYDETRPGPGPANLSHLVRTPAEARDLRRRLSALLSATVAELGALEAGKPNGSLVDFVRAADLTHLALLERRLNQNASEQLMALAVGPTLDDNLLFGHLSQLRELGEPLGESPAANLTLQRAELDYCLYMRQLYEGGPDPIGLLARRQVATSNRSRAEFGWRREPNHSISSSKSRARRAQITSTFNHLQRVHLLNHLLQSRPQEESYSRPDSSGLSAAENPAHSSEKFRRRSNLDNRLPQASFDLILGYLQAADSRSAGEQPRPEGTIYPNIIKRLTDRARSEGNISEHLLALLRLADLQFILSWTGQPEVLAQSCDFISALSNTSSSNWTPMRSTFVFLMKLDSANRVASTQAIDQQGRHESSFRGLFSDLIAEGFDVQELANFVSTGDPNGYTENNARLRWSPYTTLNRYIKLTAKPENWSVSSLQDEILLRLDAMPYLSFIGALTTAKNSSLNSDRMSDLAGCLGEIELALTRLPMNQPAHPEEVRCLSNSVATHRTQLRQYAAEDLERLVRWTRQQQVDSPHPLQSVPITTRNLVSDESANESHLDSYDSSESNNTVVTIRIGNSTTTTYLPPNIHSFLSKAYTDASGRPLLFVVGGGLSILMLNLVIVAIIAIRASRARRRQNRSMANSSSDNNAQTDGGSGSADDYGAGTEPMSRVQLTSSLKRAQNGSRMHQKRLKFDLSGVAGKMNQGEEDLSSCPFVSPVEQLTTLSFAENRQNQLMYDLQSEPLLLSATHLLDQYAPVMQQLAPMECADRRLLSQGEREAWVQSDEVAAIPAHLSAHESNANLHASLSPPMPNQSQSSSTSFTGRHRRHLARQAQTNQQLQVAAANAFAHCSHSITSPSSSTTISLTPIQLESAGAADQLNGFSPQYQLKPIGLLYQTEAAEGEEKTMFLVENAPPVNLDLNFTSPDQCYQLQ